MNDATKLRIRRELAERMGFLLLPTDSDSFTLCFPSGEPVGGANWPDPADVWSDAPDPFTSHADCAALVGWLAEQTMFVQERFHSALVAKIAQYGIAPGALEYLTSPLETRVLVACEALEIRKEDE